MKKTKFILLGLLMTASFFSCNNNEIIDDISKTDTDTNFVEKREAIALATMLEYDIYNEATKTRSTTYLEVDDTTPLGDGEKPSYYIINYKDNSGFVIIAADKRADPILAFSTEGNFNLHQNELPGGLVEWMSSTNEYIKDIRESKNQQLEVRGKKLCYALKSTALGGKDDENCFEYNGSNCPPESQKSETVLPLLQTEWGQGVGYNDLLPTAGCNSYSNKKYPTGCVATAVAQVMKYHQYPKTYNWSEMYNTSGTSETAKLMRDVGKALDTNYGCDGSSAYMSDVPKVFKNWGYSSATYGDFDITILKNQLSYKQPVILSGSRDSGLGFLGIAWTGHAWVCDGYQSSTSCTSSSLYLHMNWGWGSGSGANGWYGSFWKPNISEGYNYEFNHRMVYYIKP